MVELITSGGLSMPGFQSEALVRPMFDMRTLSSSKDLPSIVEYACLHVDRSYPRDLICLPDQDFENENERIRTDLRGRVADSPLGQFDGQYGCMEAGRLD